MRPDDFRGGLIKDRACQGQGRRGRPEAGEFPRASTPRRFGRFGVRRAASAGIARAGWSGPRAWRSWRQVAGRWGSAGGRPAALDWSVPRPAGPAPGPSRSPSPCRSASGRRLRRRTGRSVPTGDVEMISMMRCFGMTRSIHSAREIQRLAHEAAPRPQEQVFRGLLRDGGAAARLGQIVGILDRIAQALGVDHDGCRIAHPRPQPPQAAVSAPSRAAGPTRAPPARR